jgi:hypothetical protein
MGECVVAVTASTMPLNVTPTLELAGYVLRLFYQCIVLRFTTVYCSLFYHSVLDVKMYRLRYIINPTLEKFLLWHKEKH